MLLRDVARIGIGDVERRRCHVGHAARVMHALEREEHHPEAACHAVREVVHALDVRPVHAFLRVVRAAGIEEEKAPRVLAGVEHALHLRVHVHAAAAVAGADEVRVAVPNLGRVEAFPCGLHQLVLGEPARQPREAGVPESLLRPVALRRERAEAGGGSAAEQEISSLQSAARPASS
jgi:hypothetical protein